MNNSNKKNLSLLLAISNTMWTDNNMRDSKVISHTPLSNGSTKSEKNDHWHSHSHSHSYSVEQVILVTTFRGGVARMGGSKQHSRAYRQEEQQFQNVNPMLGLQVQRLPKKTQLTQALEGTLYSENRQSKVSFYSEHWFLVARGFHPAGSAGRWSQWTHSMLQAKDHIHSPPGTDTAWVSQRPYNTQLGRTKYTSDLEQRNVFPNKAICPSGCEGSLSPCKELFISM